MFKVSTLVMLLSSGYWSQASLIHLSISPEYDVLTVSNPGSVPLDFGGSSGTHGPHKRWVIGASGLSPDPSWDSRFTPTTQTTYNRSWTCAAATIAVGKKLIHRLVYQKEYGSQTFEWIDGSMPPLAVMRQREWWTDGATATLQVPL